MLTWIGNDLVLTAVEPVGFAWPRTANAIPNASHKRLCSLAVDPTPHPLQRSSGPKGADRQTAIAINTPQRLFLGRACKEITPNMDGVQSGRYWAPVPVLNIISFILRPGLSLPTHALCGRFLRDVRFI